MQHHAAKGPAFPLAPMRPTAWRRTDPAMRLQGQPNPVVAAREAMFGAQLLPEVPGREVPIPGVEQLQHRHHRVYRQPPARRPAQAAVIKTLRARSLEPVAPAPEGPLRNPQYRRRFMLAQPPRRRAFVNLLELHQSQSLYLFCPPHRSPPYGDLLNPDRSFGT